MKLNTAKDKLEHYRKDSVIKQNLIKKLTTDGNEQITKWQQSTTIIIQKKALKLSSSEIWEKKNPILDAHFILFYLYMYTHIWMF